MDNNENWPFGNGRQVTGMRLTEYLAWASGSGKCRKKLLLPIIQRGFVWKPWQIADLWDSLLRGMPVGSLMLSTLSKGQMATGLNPNDRKAAQAEASSFALVDGQQRTLAMLLGWREKASQDDPCVWVDLGEKEQAEFPFELRISTRTQPFGFQRHKHGRLTRHDRREARKAYNGEYGSDKDLPDYKLFNNKEVRPWKSSDLCFPIKDVWAAYRENDAHGIEQFIERHTAQANISNEPLQGNIKRLSEAFARLGKIEVPLILIPEHISQPPENSAKETSNTPAPLTLLFERIGRNGASLSQEDLLFSMIKQQWPEAHDLVQDIHKGKVGYLMSATDYVMTAYRLAAAENGKIADTPRPNPNDFHRHLGDLIADDADKTKAGSLRKYLGEESALTTAFDTLYNTLIYKTEGDIGLPEMMLPHLSKGLIQALLRWFMLNTDSNVISENRERIIAFVLFWYLCIWKNEDKASKEAFKIVGESHDGGFPATKLYKELTKPDGESTGLALPLIPIDRLNEILIFEPSAKLRGNDEIFAKNENEEFVATLQERDLYKRFCWWRKPVLLWLQRAYVYRRFCNTEDKDGFKGLTDEDAVPYDYDHLCPQNHWGADWRSIEINIPPELNDKDIRNNFQKNRADVGNSIGNLHVLESSLNRSFGDDPLELKLASNGWTAADSLLFVDGEHEGLWLKASPDEASPNTDAKEYQSWNENRLCAFQEAVCRRTLSLYGFYFKAVSSGIQIPEPRTT